MLALLRQLEAACPTADDLAEAVEEAFSPDAESSSASPASSSAPGCWPRSATTKPLRRRARSEGRSWILTDHQSLGQEVEHHPGEGEERSARPMCSAPPTWSTAGAP